MAATSALGFCPGSISVSFAIKGGDSTQVSALCFGTCNYASTASLLPLSFLVPWCACMMVDLDMVEIIFFLLWFFAFSISSYISLIAGCFFAGPFSLHFPSSLMHYCMLDLERGCICLSVSFLLADAASHWRGRGSLTEDTGISPVSVGADPGTPLSFDDISLAERSTSLRSSF